MNECHATIELVGETSTCTKVLDHTGRHETTIHLEEYGAVLVKWTQ